MVWIWSSCERTLEPPKEIPKARAFSYRHKFQSDDSLYVGPNLLLTRRWTEFRTTMALRRSSREYAINMNSLPPTHRGPWEAELNWVNEKYVSLSTNWDGPFGDLLYLPLDSAGKIQHFQRNALADDSVGSNVFIVELDNWSPIGHVYIHNLITLKIDSLSYARDSIAFPYLRDINSDGKSVYVETWQGISRKDIRHLSR